MKALIQDLENRMDASIEAFRRELASLRTGRASASLLDAVLVDAYGSSLPVSQVGTVSVPEPRMITIQVWDKSLVKSTEKAVLDVGLGINPVVDGQLIRLPIPPLSEERRRELTKVAAKYAETTKVGIRNIRRDGMDSLKAMEKSSDISEDEHHRLGEEVQELTDRFVEKVDELLKHKEKDIMQI